MSTSIVHVLKMIGPRARSIAAECDRLVSLRVPTMLRGIGSQDWSEADHAAIDAVCESAVRGAHRLPCVFAVQYIDPWSVAGSSLSCLERRDRTDRLYSDRWRLWYHVLPDRGWLTRRTTRARKCRAYRRQAEDRWLVDHVHEAASYCRAFNRPALVLVLSRAVSGSRMDDEYRRCLLDVSEG